MTWLNQALDMARAYGMHQHEAEFVPFLEFVGRRDPKVILEIGSLRGGTTAAWLTLASDLVISIDLPNGAFGAAHHGLDRAKMEARNAALAKRFPGKFAGILADSHTEHAMGQVGCYLKKAEVDLLFIDGDHTLAGVSKDFEMYAPLVRDGGLVAFHDILDTEIHRKAGCEVNVLWDRIAATAVPTWTFVGGPKDWGGIGVLEVGL